MKVTFATGWHGRLPESGVGKYEAGATVDLPEADVDRLHEKFPGTLEGKPRAKGKRSASAKNALAPKSGKET